MWGVRQRPAASEAGKGKVRWHNSLRTSIALWFGALTSIPLLVIVAAIAIYARNSIVHSAQSETLAMAEQTTTELATSMRSVMVTTRGLSDLVTTSPLDSTELTATLRAMVKATPGATGGLLILQPHDEGDAPFARYVAANNKDRDFIASGYDYLSQPWYRRTVASPSGWWSEPYLNQSAGKVWMVTYNMPLRSRGRGAETQGMVSLDLPLDNLTRSLHAFEQRPGWRVTLVAPAGTLAANAEVAVTRKMTMKDYIRIEHRSDLLPLAEAVRLRHSGQFTHTDSRTGEKRYTVVAPIDESGWCLLMSQSYDLIMLRLVHALLLLLGLGLALAIACMLLVNRLARRISQPVEELAAAAAWVGHGTFDQTVPHTNLRNEVGMLARTLEYGRLSLQLQLRKISEMGAARQKLESELSIARDIQQAMLPPGRVINSEDAHLEAFAMLEPATSVGGDFYNFTETGDGQLWFAIGDVSGKGVPAAVFMARAMTIMEVAARSGATRQPAEVLAEASKRLAEGNDTCMFATVLCGRINVRSGECLLASAAHDPPVLLHADGHREWLEVTTGPVLGIEDNHDFPLWRGWLPPGATLICYTDGVTEAFNEALQAYGGDRLLAALQPQLIAEEQCLALIADVHRFANPAPQSDDITVLAIRLYHKPSASVINPETPHADASDHSA